MPWEKSFELDEATEKAMTLFWNKGYEATSMADLTKAMEINKGSLYNAFGGKNDLFKRALLQYDRDVTHQTLAKVENLNDPQCALETLFDNIIDDCKNDPDHKGCFIVNTALEMPHHDPEIQKIVQDSLAGTETFFIRITKRGQDLGMFPKSINAEQVGSALLGYMIALRVLSRGAYTKNGLNNIRAEALNLVKI